MAVDIHALADALVLEGLGAAFGITGSGTSWQLITAFDERGVPYYPATHEAAASIMAGGFFRANRVLAAAIGIKGPGAVNMLPGIAYNHFECNPVLSLTEAYGSAVSQTRKHKRMNQRDAIVPVVNAYADLSQGPDILSSLISLARGGVPGPVHLDLAEEAGDIYTRPPISRPAGDPNTLYRAIEAATQPLVILGEAAHTFAGLDRVRKLRIPIFTTAAAKGLVDERESNAAGVFTGVGKSLSPEAVLLPQADLIIGIGLRNTEVIAPAPFDGQTFLLDTVLGDLHTGFDGTVVDLSNFDTAVLTTLPAWDDGLSQLADVRNTLQNTLIAAEWLPAHVFEALNRLPYDHRLVMDTGSFCTVGEHLWLASTTRPYIGSSNGRFMGAGLPTAIGASIADRELPMFVAVGDGGIRMYFSELMLAAAERLPLCVIYMRDGRYGSVAGAGPGETSLLEKAIAVPGVMLSTAVEAMGIAGHVAANPVQFETALSSWDRQSVKFIEVTFDPTAYANMTTNLR
jgi:acetolactate synthase-1/2/3 large subunit